MTECSLLALDFSQIELRVAAHESQDPTMLDIYRNDGDIHMTTACHMFGLPPEQIDDYKHRKPAKKVNFQTIYLTSPQGLLTAFQHEGLTEFGLEDCAGFLDSWRETYPGFFDWVEEVKGEMRRTGMVRDMFGRIRWIPELQSSLKYVREAGIRQGVNAPIQCLPGYTRVRTSRGYEEIGSLIHKDITVWTGSEWASAKAICKGTGETVKVRTDDGFSFDCDTAHYLLVQRTAWPGWVNVMDLKEGDVLVTGLPDTQDGGEQIESPEFWYWIGRYYGDGHLFHLDVGSNHPRSGKRMNSSRRKVDWYFGGVKRDESQRLTRFLEKEGYSFYTNEDFRSPNSKGVIRICSSSFNLRMLELGIKPNETSWEKRVADIVFVLDAERKKAFVQGYYDADGTRPKKYPNGLSAYAITSVNYGLLKDTALIARSVGILCNIRGPYSQKSVKHRDFYRLNLYAPDVKKKVVSVKMTGEWSEVFTLCVEHEHHSFDSEGVISKNSGAGGILKEAMRRLTPIVNQWQDDYGVVCRPLLQVHDELIFEVEDEYLPVIAPQFHEVMCTAVELTVPVKVDCEVGKDWKNLEEYPL
jgi:intein/homing endonuclease